jgi:ArsR family transcriptional regulator
MGMANAARAGARLPLADDGCDPPPVLTTGLAKPEAARLARAFAALADPARLRLLSMIAAQPGGEVCACALTGPLGKSQPTVSHHLKVLFNAGLVEREKRSTWVWYRIIPERLSALREALEMRGTPGGDSSGDGRQTAAVTCA